MGLLSRILSHIRCKKVTSWIIGESVLDIGCGEGLLLNVLPKKMEYCGVDSNLAQIKKAKRRNFENAVFHCLHVEKNAFPFNKKFENIVMCAFIEHIEDPNQILYILKDYLAKDGRLLITTPTEKSKKMLQLGSKIGLFNLKDFQEHKKHFSKKDLIDTLNQSGFQIEFYEEFEFGFNQLAVAKHKNVEKK